jgi:hypothetical protein
VNAITGGHYSSHQLHIPEGIRASGNLNATRRMAGQPQSKWKVILSLGQLRLDNAITERHYSSYQQQKSNKKSGS